MEKGPDVALPGLGRRWCGGGVGPFVEWTLLSVVRAGEMDSEKNKRNCI